MNTRKRILVLCTGNSCRSQMAEGYLKKFIGENAEIYSAGIETHGVNPKAIEIMAEDGVDISNHTSNLVDEYAHIHFDYMLTVCDHAREHCPFIPGDAIRLHHNFPDPAKATGTASEINEAFRRTRQLIKDWCAAFSRQLLADL